MVQTGLFGTIQFPFNFNETVAQTELYPPVREQGLGLQATKRGNDALIGSESSQFDGQGQAT